MNCRNLKTRCQQKIYEPKKEEAICGMEDVT
jgi:hypothetical protein